MWMKTGVGFAYGFVLVRGWAMSRGSQWHANDIWAGRVGAMTMTTVTVSSKILITMNWYWGRLVHKSVDMDVVPSHMLHLKQKSFETFFICKVQVIWDFSLWARQKLRDFVRLCYSTTPLWSASVISAWSSDCLGNMITKRERWIWQW